MATFNTLKPSGAISRKMDGVHWARFFGVMVLMTALGGLAGCGGRTTRAAHIESKKVAQDSQRITSIPAQATPKIASAAMGRKPDAVRHDGDRLIHYYLIQGAVNGEALRLVFRNGRLVGRSVVKTSEEY